MNFYPISSNTAFQKITQTLSENWKNKKVSIIYNLATITILTISTIAALHFGIYSLACVLCIGSSASVFFTIKALMSPIEKQKPSNAILEAISILNDSTQHESAPQKEIETIQALAFHEDRQTSNFIKSNPQIEDQPKDEVQVELINRCETSTQNIQTEKADMENTEIPTQYEWYIP
jgi:hypothetical protein